MSLELSLSDFVKVVRDFDDLKTSDKIDFFAFFYTEYFKKQYFATKDISLAFRVLRIEPYSNIPHYLLKFSERGKNQKFIKTTKGYQLIRGFDEVLKSRIMVQEKPFLNFEIDTDSLEWRPSDIPLLNSKERKSAHFFTKLYYLFYHLENSLRKFLKKRLNSIIGHDWEKEIISKVDLIKAVSIRQQTNLSEMMEERGDNILHYCMWDDYGRIIKMYPHIFNSQNESDEIVAHLSSMTKIRNGIAHNSATIPKEYQDELNVFLSKFIKILKKY